MGTDTDKTAEAAIGEVKTSSPFVSDTESASTTEQPPIKDVSLLKAAQKKVDRRIILWYSFVYLIMRIHVSNITNTAIINIEEGDGIKKQLGNLTSGQWAWVSKKVSLRMCSAKMLIGVEHILLPVPVL